MEHQALLKDSPAFNPLMSCLIYPSVSNLLVSLRKRYYLTLARILPSISLKIENQVFESPSIPPSSGVTTISWDGGDSLCRFAWGRPMNNSNKSPVGTFFFSFPAFITLTSFSPSSSFQPCLRLRHIDLSLLKWDMVGVEVNVLRHKWAQEKEQLSSMDK